MIPKLNERTNPFRTLKWATVTFHVWKKLSFHVLRKKNMIDYFYSIIIIRLVKISFKVVNVFLLD